MGAGASGDAGILTIKDMTTEFLSDPLKSNSSLTAALSPQSSNQIKNDFAVLAKVTEKFLGKTRKNHNIVNKKKHAF